ncbi:MAG: hypothetical protein C0601_09965 [Candidatus Muiribacterium halophilum]|uniref:Glycosyl transferase family 1 domain-containing protein n=1 Tax=Muiribacterium halophilum TaxID=2053465 RepID=A0A2N5ZD54_MUIH1|nr:MAG: hypothetical protein C0601_09965 [Candidatus Muirbacterium halophilum]
MKNKRILFLSSIFPPETGGPASYCENILKYLSKKGIELSLITSYSENKKNNVIYNFPHKQFKGTTLTRALLFMINSTKILFYNDIVFSMTSPQDTFLSLIIARLIGKKAFLRIGGRYHLELKNKLKSNFVLIVMKVLSKAGVHFISVSPSTTDYLRNIGIKPFTEIQNPFFPVDKKNTIDFYENKNIRLLTVSRLTTVKNISQILKLIKNTERTELIIAGSGPLYKRLKDEAKYLLIEDRVVFKGHLEGKELDDLYNNSHFYITFSDFEGSPNSIIKALGHNLPLIAPYKLINTQVINTKNAFLFENTKTVSEYLNNLDITSYKKIKNNTHLKEVNNLFNHLKRLSRTLQRPQA